jgi:DNA-binding transcriptional LysR family regulator
MQALIMPALHVFFLKYPDIDLEVIATRDILDLAV